MSGPVTRPLEIKESDNSVRVKPATVLNLNAADFTVSATGSEATVSLASGGSGASLTDTYIGFGDSSNLLTGSANFTFTEESGGSGPTVLLTGDKPIIDIQDDTAATDYKTRLSQSGASLYVSHIDSAGTDKEMIRISNTYVFFNDDGEDIDVKMEGTSEGNLFRLDAAQNNIGIATSPASDVERLHVKGTAASSSDPLVRFESTDAGTTKAPLLEFYRNSASPADSDYIGAIHFSGNNVSGTKTEYARILSQINDISAATEDAAMYFQVYEMGTPRTILTLHKSAVVINENQRNIDFRVESDNNANMILVDAGQDNIGIATAPDSNVQRLHVVGDSTNTSTSEAVVKIENDRSGAVFTALELVNESNDSNSDVLMRMTSKAGTDSDFEILHNSFGTTSFSSNQPNSGAVEAFRISDTEMQINNGSIDFDFQVKADSGASGVADPAHALFVQGSTGNVGLGTNSPENQLHIKQSSDSTLLMLEQNEDSDAAAPSIYMWKHRANPVNGDNLGIIYFAGEDSGGARSVFASIRCVADDITATSEDSSVSFYLRRNNQDRQNLRIRYSEVVVNEDSDDCNFRVEGNGNSSLLICDAGNDQVYVGASGSASGAQLQVDEDASFLLNYTSDNSATVAVTAAQAHNGIIHGTYDAAAQAFTLPTAVSGMCVTIVRQQTTNAPTIAPAVGEKINGGTGTVSISAQYGAIVLHGVTGTGWIAYEPAVAS